MHCNSASLDVFFRFLFFRQSKFFCQVHCLHIHIIESVNCHCNNNKIAAENQMVEVIFQTHKKNGCLQNEKEKKNKMLQCTRQTKTTDPKRRQ